MRENIAVVDDLTSFIFNEGFISEDKPPKENEPYYDQFIAAKMKNMGLSYGDRLKLDIGHTNIEGILLTSIGDDTKHVEILEKGKRVWADRGNVKTLYLGDIKNISLEEKAKEDFNIKDVDIHHDDDMDKKLEKLRNSQVMIEETRDVLKTVNSKMTKDTVFLRVMPTLYCPEYYPAYDSSKHDEMTFEKASITILYKNGETDNYKDLKVRKFFPNKDYITACNKNSEIDDFILPFDSFEEMTCVDGVACTWTVYVGEEKMSLTHIVYIDFKRHESYPIYNVVFVTSPLESHAMSLYKKTIFSGKIYDTYNFVGINLNDEELIMIKNDMDWKTTIDAAIALHGSRENAVAAFSNNDELYNEIFVEKQIVEGLYHCAKHVDYTIKTKINFDKFFKDLA